MISILVRDFATTQEKHLTPTLSSANLIFVQSGKYRPKVIAIDEMARQAGVNIGMTVNQAQAICPTAEILPVEESRYRRIFNDITLSLLDITNRIEPEYQPTSAVWYTDDTLVLSYLLDSIHQQTCIIPQVGFAKAKFTARVASAIAKQGNPIRVVSKDERSFLAPYAVSLLPLDKKMKRRLPLLGIQTLGQFASLPRIAIWEQFGKHGRWLHDLASGKDIRQLSPFKPTPQLSQTLIFEDGIVDWQYLQRSIEGMSLCLIALLEGRQAWDITLILHLDDKTVLEHHRQLHKPICDNLYLLRTASQMLSAMPIQAAVEQLEIRLNDIRQRKPVQLSLFDPKPPVQQLDTLIPEWASRYPKADFFRLIPTGYDQIPERLIERQKVVGA